MCFGRVQRPGKGCCLSLFAGLFRENISFDVRENENEWGLSRIHGSGYLFGCFDVGNRIAILKTNGRSGEK
jgi:hypothetical protein